MVAAVVPAALQGSLFWSEACDGADTLYELAAAVFGVARLVEPGFRIAGTVDTIELEGRIADHRVDLVANNKGSGILAQHLDAVALVHVESGRLAQLTDTNLALGTYSLGRVAPLVVRRSVSSCLDVPTGPGGLAGVGKGSASKDFVPFQIDNGEFFATVACGYIIELLFRVFGQVARLVYTDTADTEVLCVTESLVQRVGNDSVWNKVLGHGSDGGHGIVLAGVRSILAETLDGTAVVCGGRIPLHGPYRTNQVIGCRLFLVNRSKSQRCQKQSCY